LQYGDRIGVTTLYPGYVATPIHQRSEELGFSLAEAVPEDSIADVVKAMADACYARKAPRDVATSRLTRTGIFFGRHFPRATDAATRRQIRRLQKRGHFTDLKFRSDVPH
jgi:NAD(P)-dependent dehydrogenase (short-subunit alcohol dehydrogenase family)